MGKNFYAGIGSRETPETVLNQMNRIAIMLQTDGWWLSSGGARGADTAFERGAGVRRRIFKAQDATPDALALAKKYHPAWDRCTATARALHARNGMILLGPDLDDPVKFVVCWTPDGKATGGTGQALRIAADPQYAIPVFNLFFPSAEKALATYLTSLVW